MLTNLLAHVCQEDCLLSPDRIILVGVSGGPDSLCLLHTLIGLGYPVVAACFDHALRQESAEEARFVAKTAARLGVAFVTAREDVPALAAREHLSMEEAARTARYRFLFSEARRCGAQAVAVGHTADDQVETVLMHLLRGAGLAGLKGMTHRGVVADWDATIPVVRPLLGVWREQTVAYCHEQNLAPILDASNANPAFFRNRLRHELIPFLQTYNPQVKGVLARTAQTLAADYQALDGLAAAAWDECEARALNGEVSLALPAFRVLLPALRRAVLRRAVAALRPAQRDVDFSAIRRAEEFALHPRGGGQIDLVSGLRLSISADHLWLTDGARELDLSAYPQVKNGEALELPVPGQVDLLNGWRLCAALVEDVSPTGYPLEPEQVWLDAAALEFPLVVRSQTPGARFHLLGMGGHSLKLSDLWVNRRVPRAVRAGWPLVYSGQNIVWIPLHGPSEMVRVNAATHRVVHLRVDPDR